MNPLAIAWDSIWHHRTRSLLTALGVLIGVFAVVTLTSLGGSVNAYITGKFSTFGANLITVTPASPGGKATGGGGVRFGSGRGGGGFLAPAQSTLTTGDVAAIAALPSSEIAAVAGVVQVPVTLAKSSGGVIGATVLGVSPAYFGLERLDFQSGRMTSNQVVLGSALAKTLLGSRTALGGTVRLNGEPYTVSGILKSTGNILGGNPDQMAFVPLDLGLNLGKVSNLTEILVSARSTAAVNTAAQRITSTLGHRHPTRDFQVTTAEKILSTVQSTLNVLTGFLAGIAGISLLVGGIGIMNIMLVTVAERVREVGIRKAMGARDGDILGQFLLESVLLGLVGGALGTASAALATKLLGRAVGIPAGLTPSSVLLALVFSVGVGVIFGVLPAARASRLLPAAALRTD